MKNSRKITLLILVNTESSDASADTTAKPEKHTRLTCGKSFCFAGLKTSRKACPHDQQTKVSTIQARSVTNMAVLSFGQRQSRRDPACSPPFYRSICPMAP